MRHLVRVLISCGLLCVFLPAFSALADSSQTRQPRSEEDLRRWLENMVWHHRYSVDEVSEVTGLDAGEVRRRLDQWSISSETRPPRRTDKLFVLPYPGGRHPRIGFLDGAIDPQRETKLSVFAPWDQESYAVLDVPEAIWSNLGLTYLAHTHIDTVWSKQRVDLEQLEWTSLPDGSYEMVRRLPNGIEFGIKVIPLASNLRMKMWLHNGTDEPLSDLRVQNCVMLKGMKGFTQQSNANKSFENGYAIAHAPDRTRWVISAWDPVHRAWGNDRCPCLHSDPKFPDCPPGETRWLRGWFSFYQGEDIQQELQRIEQAGWRTHPLHHVTGNLVGKVVDADSGNLLPCRLYVQNLQTDEWAFASSTAVAGEAVVYDKRHRNTHSIERHTSLSADGFQFQLPAGRYRLRAEHGKEYLPEEQQLELGETRQQVTLKLKRIVNMAERGWFSGDTHVHRSMSELPTAMLAEDLNVALPLNYWVRDSREIPAGGDVTYQPLPNYVDKTHVIYPINTEYEIFTVDGRPHTQGAVFVLGHREPLQLVTPPVRPVAEAARQQGALLDLDKHSWNWSLMIVPIMDVDLFELSNNHHWRSEFGFPAWTRDNAPPSWPGIEMDSDGFTERGWTEFGLRTYYALLNCGFRLRVSAGTASGVHPVPLGYSRVYAHTGAEFSYRRWMEQLDRGHSFVTQGPLLDVRFNDELPGITWQYDTPTQPIRITGSIYSATELESIEIVRSGELISLLPLATTGRNESGYVYPLDAQVQTEGSGWLAVRCFAKPPNDAPDGKVVFAHTNPVFIDVPNYPLKPRREEVEYFVQRMESEIERNQGILSAEGLTEYEQALQIYERLLRLAE